MRYFGLLLLCAVVSSWALAEEEAPQPMPKVQQGNVPDDEGVHIRAGSHIEVEEMQRGGQTVLLVRPSKGRPYYLVDTDGDGNFDSVQWVLFRF